MPSIFVPNLLIFVPNLENWHIRKIYTLSNPFIVCKAMDIATKIITILVEGLNNHSRSVVHICFYNTVRNMK